MASIPLDAAVRKAKRVVVVPWDYDSACTPVPYSRSARWLKSRTIRFFHPTLRDRAYWAGGMPTYDAFVPQFQVFPSTQEDPVFPPEEDVTTAEQLFEVFERMPDHQAVDSLDLAALQPFRAWAEARPGLSHSWPVHELIHDLVARAHQGSARKVALPMLGTYRIDLTLPTDSVRTFYARTSSRPVGVATSYRGIADTLPRSAWDSERYIGVKVMFLLAEGLDSLPAHFDYRKRGNWEWEIAWRDSSGVWPANMDPWNYLPANDSTTRSVSARLENWFDHRWNLSSMPNFLGRFISTPDGGYVYRARWEFEGGGRLAIEATRISTETFYQDRDPY